MFKKCCFRFHLNHNDFLIDWFIYLQASEPPLGLIQIGGDVLGSKLVYYNIPRSVCGTCGVCKADLEDIDLAHPKTFFYF